MNKGCGQQYTRANYERQLDRFTTPLVNRYLQNFPMVSIQSCKLPMLYGRIRWITIGVKVPIEEGVSNVGGVSGKVNLTKCTGDEDNEDRPNTKANVIIF